MLRFQFSEPSRLQGEHVMGVFVSYSSRDKDAVTRLTQDLQEADEQVWLDQRLAGGDAWWRAILEQIRGCEVFIFAMSRNSIESKPCRAELRYAQTLKLPILPVQVGSVQSMQLNPVAKVQIIDYQIPTPGAAMRLLSALHRARTQRQPLPSELPPEPPVPFEYLIRLYNTVSSPDQLSPRDQAALVAQLQVGLREDGDNDTARGEIVMLLGKLREREDVTYRIRTDVDAILDALENGQLSPQGGPWPAPELTVAPRHYSPSWPLIHEGDLEQHHGVTPDEREDTATTDTTEPRVETPPPSTTPAQKVTVPRQNSQGQTETTRGREKLQIFVRRSTAVHVAMAVTAVILIVIAVPLIIVGNYREDSYRNGVPLLTDGSICIAIAAGLIIGVVRVRRRAASEATRVRETPSARRSTATLAGMAVTAAAFLLALGITTTNKGSSDNQLVGTTCIAYGAIIIASLVGVLIVRAIRR
jgi:hypothetical protein